MKRISLGLAALSCVITASSALAESVTVYDSIPAPLPVDIRAFSFESSYLNELGERVVLAAGPRSLSKVDLVLYSIACESGSLTNSDCLTTPGATFSHPITLNFYAIGSGGALSSIGSVTQNVAIPFRPSIDTTGNCTDKKWWDGSVCHGGVSAVVTFDGAGLADIVLPDEFVFGVTYNTTRFGYSPIGTTSGSSPYDLAGIGMRLYPSYGPPSVGIDATGELGIYANVDSTGPSNYCDGGVGGTDTFRLDDGCRHATVAIRFETAESSLNVALSGFSSPVDPQPTLNRAKAGQTIPLKFYVVGQGGAPVTDLASVTVVMKPISCSGPEVGEIDPIEQYTSGSQGLINLGGGYYQWNWKTLKGTSGCQLVSLSLPDGYASDPVRLEANFQFVK